jgi:FeS assembly protein IscX
MKWIDSLEIAMKLHELYPDVDPLTLRFTELRNRVLELPGFDDDPLGSNEGRLEAIQMAWCDEREV